MLKKKIIALKQNIRTWNKDHFGDTYTHFKKVEEELNKMDEVSAHKQLEDSERVLRKKL